MAAVHRCGVGPQVGASAPPPADATSRRAWICVTVMPIESEAAREQVIVPVMTTISPAALTVPRESIVNETSIGTYCTVVTVKTRFPDAVVGVTVAPSGVPVTWTYQVSPGEAVRAIGEVPLQATTWSPSGVARYS